MASLLNKTTSSQLGIGGGDVGEFATGVKKKKKSNKELTPAQIANNQGANEQGDARLQAQSDVNVDYDPKADNAANLMLDTNDEMFINQVQQMKSDLFAGNFKGGGGVKGDTAGFLALADSSSRGGIANIWNDTIEMATKGEIGPRKLALLQESFNKAYETTSAVMNLDVNVGTYSFDQAAKQAGPSGNDLIVAKEDKVKGEGLKKDWKAAKKVTKKRAKADSGISVGAVGSFAWDTGAQLKIG